MAEEDVATDLRHPLAPRSRGRLIGVILGVAAVYIVTARLGLIFAMADGVVTAVWPPAGVAIASLLLFGFRVWPGIWLGSFVANAWGLLPQGATTNFWAAVGPSTVTATGSLLGALISVGLLLCFERDRHPLATVNGVFRLVAIGLLGCVISASVGGAVLCLIGHSAWAQFPLIWLTWWAGDAVGVVVFTPVFLAWGRPDRFPMKARPLEALAALGSLALVSGYVFLAGVTDFFGGKTHAFLCLPPMIWMSLRLGSRGVATGLLLLAGFAIWGTVHRTGPFAGAPTLNNALLALDSFLVVSVLVCLCTTAASWMRREAAESLREANRTLETRVTERTRSLQEIAERLRDSQQRLQLTIEAANIGYWEYDPATRTGRRSISVSQPPRPLPPEEQTALEVWQELLHPEERQRVMVTWEDYVAGRTSVYSQEYRLRQVDGSYRWVHSLGQYETKPAGEGRRILGCHIDITNRKKIELQWTLLATLARQLNATTDIKGASRLIVDTADTLIGWDASAVFSYDAETDLARTVLNLDVLNGQRTDLPPAVHNVATSRRLRRTLEQGAELVLRQGPSEFSSEPYSFGDPPRPAASLMFVPIRDGQRAVGMLTIQSYRLNAYTPTDLETLQTLADHCGSALARLRTEELHRETAARLREAQAIARIGSLYWNIRAKQMTWSEELFRIHGHDPRQFEATYEALLIAAHPADGALLTAVIDTTLRTKAALSHDYRILRRDGQTRWLHLQGRVTLNDQQEVVGLEGTCQDITERKRAEAALRESQEHLELAAGAAQIGFWDWHLETNEVQYSPEWKAQLGFAPDELDNRYETWRDRLHPEDREPAIAKMTAYLEGGVPDYEAEFRQRHKDDSYRWMYSRGKLLRNEAGQPYRVLGGNVDITERKYAEMNLRESREQLRLLFETANDAVLLVTPSGHILSANRAACEMFQYAEAELRQLGQAGITDPADERVPQAIQARNTTGAFRGELTFRRQDGGKFPGEVSTALMGQAMGQQIATVFVRDITQRKQLEAEQANGLSLLQAAIESGGEGLVVVDLEGQVTIYNRRFVELWRVPETLLATRSDDGLVHWGAEQLAEPDEFLATVKHLYAHPEQERFDILKFKDGRCYERYSQPQRLGERIVGRVWSFRDVTEQRRAEAAVRNSEARLHLALEVSRMASWDWDLQTNAMVSDPRLLPLFAGPGVSGLVNEPDFRKFIHPDDQAIVRAAIQEAVAHTNHYLAVFRVVWPDQTVRWLEGCGMVFRAETGRPVRMVGVTADITERQRAEESLRRSQQQYAELVNNVDGIVWEADARTAAMTFVSSQAERILGYPVSAWTASDTFWQDHLHPADREAAINFCVERTRLGQAYEFTYRMIAADGRSVWIRDLVKVAMEDGEPVKLRGILLDVTTSKLADELAAGQSRALELIARSAPLSRTLNELCLALEAQLPGARCSVWLADESRSWLVPGAAPSLPEAFNRAVEELPIGPQSGSCGTAAYRREPVIVTDIATDPLWVSWRDLALAHDLRACWSMPILDTHRQVVGTFAIYRNSPGEPTTHDWSVIESTTNTAAIAILKHQADQQLERSAEILRQLSANLLDTQETERRHLARELHDEVGQTLTATKILLEGLQQQESPAAVGVTNASKRLGDAIQCVNHLLTVVRDLSLSLRPPMLDDFGLRPALRWLLDQHTRTTGRPVTFDASSFTHKPAPALETACFRIAQESLTNITRHSQAKQVSVALHSEEDSFTLVVRDDGVGFEVAAARARALRGGSLGLLGQQERAALVGGRVEIVSAPGTGTEVRVWFPLSLEENTAKA